MNVEMFLHYIKEMVALLVEDLFATRNRHDFALHTQDRGAICKLDVEVVTSEGHNLLFYHKGLRAAGEELRENANWRGHLSEVCHRQ